MAPLAQIALESGCRVTGSDQIRNSKCAELAAAGAVITTGHHAGSLPADAELLIYSSAVPADNPERAEAARRGLPQLRRGEFLAEICRDRQTVAISSSHGKTTTTAMLVHVLLRCGMDPGFLIGGSVPGLPSGHAGRDRWFITEADESDTTHTLLHPAIGMILNIDDDHAWSVGGTDCLLANFRRFAQQSATLLYSPGHIPAGLLTGHPAASEPSPLPDGSVPELGGFLRINAAFALRAAIQIGIPEEKALAALSTFPGVARRMTVRRNDGDMVLIEDYAHHPVELAASLAFLRERYPHYHLRVLFQPHRHARLAKYLDEFAVILRQADSVLIAPVFAAWSEGGPVDHRELARRTGEKARAVSGSWESIAGELLAEPARPQVTAVIGAGDLDRVFAYL